MLLGALWGASFLFMRLANQELGALPTVGVRVAIASVFLLCVLFLRGQGAELRSHWRKTLFVGTINSGLPFACYSFALLSISTGLSSILNATAPMFGAVVAWAWLGDRPDRSRLFGLLIGFAGISLLAWDKASFRPRLGSRALSAGLPVLWHFSKLHQTLPLGCTLTGRSNRQPDRSHTGTGRAHPLAVALSGA